MSPAHDRLRAAPWPKTRWRRGRHVIGRVAAGDLIAMSQLYDHYVERVHALITMRLRLRGDTDTSRAWDLTRQTFVALWRTALTRPPDATPNEWVLGTAQSVSDEAGEHAVGGV